MLEELLHVMVSIWAAQSIFWIQLEELIDQVFAVGIEVERPVKLLFRDALAHSWE